MVSIDSLLRTLVTERTDSVLGGLVTEMKMSHGFNFRVGRSGASW